MTDRLADTENLDVMEVVRGLEESARSLRARIAELGELLDEAEEEDRQAAADPSDADTALHSPAELRAAVLHDLREAREDADARLAEVTATLEAIQEKHRRIDREDGDEGRLGAELRSARELSAEVDRFLTETPAS